MQTGCMQLCTAKYVTTIFGSYSRLHMERHEFLVVYEKFANFLENKG